MRWSAGVYLHPVAGDGGNQPVDNFSTSGRGVLTFLGQDVRVGRECPPLLSASKESSGRREQHAVWITFL